MENRDLEAVGPSFTNDRMLAVRHKTRAAIQRIAAKITPGMLEKDAVEMARDLLADNEMVRGWHDVIVRFGKNTLKSYGAESEVGVTLKANDIFFIDIGPVWEEWEGDGGDTFVVGSDAGMQRCAAQARELFHLVRHQWQASGMSGKQLYDFAAAAAAAMGWELNMELAGHRLSDFPHAAIYNGSMADITFKPAALLWVLEIHIRHPTGAYGAFFEDMLLDDSHFV